MENISFNFGHECEIFGIIIKIVMYSLHWYHTVTKQIIELPQL